MKCQQCGTENSLGAQHCRQCGAPLPATPICPACGTPARSGARFCARCGAPLATTPAPPQPWQSSAPATVPAPPPQSYSPSPPPAPYGAQPAPPRASRSWIWIAAIASGVVVLALLSWLVLARVLPLLQPAATAPIQVTQQSGEPLPTTEAPAETPAPTTAAPTQNTQAPAPTATFTPEPTATPCLPDAKFVADLTIPDNQKLAPGAAFTKSWRVRSTGCAAWPSGTELVFINGERLEAPASVAVPAAAPESTADISVDMRAPTAPGTYRSHWQLRGPDGVFFGSRIYAQIIVPGPLSISFVADRTTIQQGQCATLSWQVENAVSVLLNGREVAAQGSSVECPTGTTVFEISAKDIEGNWKRATVTIKVETGY